MKKILIALLLLSSAAVAHDLNHPELNDWLMSLHNKEGTSCCSNNDGTELATDDWKSENGHYSVLLDGKWVEVPDKAVITVPNRAQRAMVWTCPRCTKDFYIRCFMPGALT